MVSPLDIAFVSSEVRPFAATGGLGDVASALPKALLELGHNARLVMPGYAMIEGEGYALQDVPALKGPITVPGIGRFSCKKAVLPDTKVPVYFLQDVDQDYFRRTGDRSQLYGWPDDARRFIALCRGTLELLQHLAWKPDVIHCNDWQAGLIPAYLDSLYKYDFLNTATLYTTHNLLYSGPGGLGEDALQETGLGSELVSELHPHAFYGQFNFAQGALTVADVVNTVSPTYAHEVLQPESSDLANPVHIPQDSDTIEHTVRIPNGVGFYRVLRQRTENRPFLGILNGIDVDYWNPETDPLLELPHLIGLAGSLSQPIEVQALPLDALNYAASDSRSHLIARKRLNKTRLQQLCGLEPDETKLLIGRVARIGDQKDYLLMTQKAKALRALLDAGAQLVVLGRAAAQDVAGQWYKQEYARLDQAYPDQICFINERWARWLGRSLPSEADFEFEHLIYTGSDAFLLPSLYEPCGLSQMVSFRYGTLPIVRRTGGLADTVRDVSEPQDPVKGGGFVFDAPEPDALIAAICHANTLYTEDQEMWIDLVEEGMSKDFSWGASAARYAEAYRLAIEIKQERLQRTL